MIGQAIKIKAGRFSGEKAIILDKDEEYGDFEVQLKSGDQKGKKILIVRDDFEFDYSKNLGASVR